MTLHEEILEIERLHNTNYIMIEQKEINEAIKEGLITEVARSKSRNGNVYYEINPICVPNAVLMHVKDDKHIVINRRVINKVNNNAIDLMDILPSFSFCTKSKSGKAKRERVITDVKNKKIGVNHIAIERLITSYSLHGELVKLSSNKHYHHKVQTYDNREHTSLFIDEETHKHSNRHQEGFYVDSINSFWRLLKQLKNNDEYYKHVTWVE